MKANQEKKEKEKPKKGIPIPAGTEQETGFTRGETEKKHAPVKKNKKKDDEDVNENLASDYSL